MATRIRDESQIFFCTSRRFRLHYLCDRREREIFVERSEKFLLHTYIAVQQTILNLDKCASIWIFSLSLFLFLPPKLWGRSLAVMCLLLRSHDWHFRASKPIGFVVWRAHSACAISLLVQLRTTHWSTFGWMVPWWTEKDTRTHTHTHSKWNYLEDYATG